MPRVQSQKDRTKFAFGSILGTMLPVRMRMHVCLERRELPIQINMLLRPSKTIEHFQIVRPSNDIFEAENKF